MNKIIHCYDTIYDGKKHIMLNSKIFENEETDYQIVDKENEIQNLINYAAETKSANDYYLITEDLKQLMNVDDKYVFSSIQTNQYYSLEDKEYQKIAEEMLELNKKYD